MSLANKSCFINGKYKDQNVNSLKNNSKFLYYVMLRINHPHSIITEKAKEDLKDVNKSTVLTVGKYKGKRIDDVIKVKAFLKFYRENVRRFTKEQREIIESKMNHNLVLYGKYKNKEYDESMKAYIKNKLNNKKFDRCFKKYNPVLYANL